MKKYLIFGFLLFALVYSGCKESIVDNPIPNKAPNTHLFLYPDSTISKQKSRLEVNWWGDDPDGIVVGYYFKWVGIDSSWTFTTKNDSIFSLPIGSKDTTFRFLVAAVDNDGNNKYDKTVIRNGINFGAEPFTDKNGNGVYDAGEDFIDIGNVDPTPAVQNYPIVNSTPVVTWSKETTLPKESFPVMTLGWDAEDLDGNSTIVKVNIALNDTTDGVVSLDGAVRLVTLIGEDLNTAQPKMKILIDGSENKVSAERLRNLRLDDSNRVFVQAVDISGAKSKFVAIPDSGSSWIIKKPKGKFLIIDDYAGNAAAGTFYENLFNSVHGSALAGKYDVLDLENTKLPYEFLTFLETVKLFDYIFWYSDSKPDIDLANLVTQKYLQGGGHIAFSMTFEDSSDTFPFDLGTLQNFLPIDSLGQKKPVPFLLSGANLLESSQASNYPQLKTSGTTGFVRTFYPSSITAFPVYDISSSQISGHIAIMNNTKNLFFIGLPLHLCNGIKGNLQVFFDKLFFEDFGLQP